MDFGLSPEQILLQDSVNRFLNAQVSLEKVREFVEGEDQGDAIWAGLTELGIPALLVSEANGGLGLSGMDAAIMAECLGYHTTPAPFLGTAVMAPVALKSSEKKQAILASIAAGEHRVGIAFNEAIAARAEAGIKWDGANLNGKSIFVIDFEADSFLIATTDKKIL